MDPAIKWFLIGTVALSVLGVFAIVAAIYSSTENATLNPFAAKTPIPVSNEQYGDFWPLTVPSGTVDCVEATRLRYRRGATVFIHNDTIYALNEDAVASGYASIEPLLKTNPDFPEYKMSINGLSTRGRENC